MKSLYKPILAALLFTSILSSCEGRKAGLSGKYTLVLNQPRELLSTNPSPTFTFSGINDSRCPINADCVWAGNATVTILVKANNKNETLKLCLGTCQMVKEENNFVFNGVAYKVVLTAANPYPGTSNAINSIATAEVVIAKK